MVLLMLCCRPAVGDGPTRHFFSLLLQGVTMSGLLEESVSTGGLLPNHSLTDVADGRFRIIGCMIAHSVLHCGLAFPMFAKPVYQYIIDGMQAVLREGLSVTDLQAAVDINEKERKQ